MLNEAGDAAHVVSVVLAVRSVRRGDVAGTAAGMIRAFAVGVGTVRIWLGLFEGLGLLDFQSAWGPAFWVGHVDLPLYKSGPNHPGLRAVPTLGGARAFLRGLWHAAEAAAFDQSISC